MANLKIGRMMLGICQTNCYFVYREGTKDVIFLTLPIKENIFMKL